MAYMPETFLPLMHWKFWHWFAVRNRIRDTRIPLKGVDLQGFRWKLVSYIPRCNQGANFMDDSSKRREAFNLKLHIFQ